MRSARNSRGVYFDPYVERLKRGENCTYERLVGPPGGEARWHLVRLAPDHGREGGFNGYYIVGSDIHDIKLAQERLAARKRSCGYSPTTSPTRWRTSTASAASSSPTATSPQQRGTTPERSSGARPPSCSAPRSAAWIAERTQKVFDRGENGDLRARGRSCPTARCAHFHVKAVPDFDDDGERARHVRRRPRHHRGEGGRRSCSPRASRTCASSPRTSPRRSSTSTSSAAARS